MQDLLVLFERLADGLPAVHHVLGVLAKLLAFAGQAHRAVVAQKERGAQFVFKLLDAAAQCGRADMLLAAGLAEVQVVCQGEKKPECLAVHVRFIYRHVVLQIYHFTQWCGSLKVLP